MNKYIRKDFFGMSADRLERILARLLENMRFNEIKIQGATRVASAAATERVKLGPQTLPVRMDISITWSEQSEGITVVITVQEAEHEWAGCMCARLADSLIGAIRTVFEMEHGVDA